MVATLLIALFWGFCCAAIGVAVVSIFGADAFFLPTPTATTATNSSQYYINRNAANTGFIISPIGTWASSTVRYVLLTGTYFTQ